MKGKIGFSARNHNKEIKEEGMFEVTEKASSVIKGFLEKQQGARAIRILSQAG
jgi:hypothetical protein